jgi:hypothetical protein
MNRQLERQFGCWIRQTLLSLNRRQHSGQIKISNLLARLYFSRYFRLTFQPPSGKCEVEKDHTERHLQAKAD